MVINKEQSVTILTYAAVAAVSSVITWYVAREIFQAQVQEQVAEVKAYYKKKADKAEFDKSDLKKYAEQDINDTLEAYGQKQFTGGEARVIEHAKLIEVNLVKEADPNRPLHLKSLPASHIITKDTFYEDDDEDFPNQEKVSATFYKGDNTLVDQYDEVVENAKAILGEDFFTAIGGDEDQIWVRNTTLKLDYEVDLERGSYAIEVLGFEPPEKEARSPMRFRERE